MEAQEQGRLILHGEVRKIITEEVIFEIGLEDGVEFHLAKINGIPVRVNGVSKGKET